jgi:ribonucleoside-diphosphate reductase alpha chain
MIFKNPASEFIYIRTYARWIEALGRRETWEETVDRYVTFLKEERGDKIPPKVLKKIREKILNFEVMPSMRALWAAGPAARQDNLTIYNCSALEVNSIESFAEALYILMCGTGEGYSVRQSSVDKLPDVPTFNQSLPPSKHVVEDSRKGWAESVRVLLTALYSGTDVDFDYSLLRPKGAKLLVMGGRSSGPAPLITLHSFIRETLHEASGRKLSTLECSDIMNQIAESVVVGGVRRSSQISLSDLQDEAMRHAKDWPFPPRRYMSNNSAIYETKPSAVEFLKEWSALAASGTGERGIFNLESLRKYAPTRRSASLISLTNPCGEIALRDRGLCNLSEVVVRAEDDLDSLLDKVETATWLGAIQSTFTNFSYVGPQWKANAEEERLLGVSLTGQMDNPEMMKPEYLKALKSKAIKVARHASIKLGINMPAAITCTKPSGTVSQLVDSASGIHARFAPYYIRRYRISATDPLCKLLRDQGVKLTPENGQENLRTEEITTYVVSFPSKSPQGAITKDQLTALEQLEIYKKTQGNWCEHNVSMTVYVKDHEWFDVGNWVYNNWDFITGLSFLPFDGGKYKQAPYEEITKDQYEKMIAKFPHIDYSQLSRYETSDLTEGAKSYSCVGDKCELV